MGLLKNEEKAVFDTEAIHEGDLLLVTCEGWAAPRSGIVLRVSEHRLTYLHHPGISNVGIQLELFAADIAAGGYTLRWSSDLNDVYRYPVR